MLAPPRPKLSTNHALVAKFHLDTGDFSTPTKINNDDERRNNGNMEMRIENGGFGSVGDGGEIGFYQPPYK